MNTNKYVEYNINMPAPLGEYSSDFYIYKALDMVYDTCKIHPNIITGMGFMLTPIIAYFMIRKQKWPVLFVGILCFLFDCLDGMVARKCDLQTKSGERFDHISDCVKLLVFSTIWMNQLNMPYHVIGILAAMLSVVFYLSLFTSMYTSFSNSMVHDNLMIAHTLAWYLWCYSLNL